MEGRRDIRDNVSVVKSLIVSVKKFWKKYETEFVSFWHTLSTSSREDFLQSVYPTLPYSLNDRYCFESGVKAPTQRYDLHLLLDDTLTISNLAQGNNLIAMMVTSIEDEHLKIESSEAVVKLRELHKRNAYPFNRRDREQYNRELNLQKGDYMYNNTIEENFGQSVQINDPYTLINGTGTLGPDGSRISFYRWGLFTHPIIEHEHIMDLLFLQMSLLTNAIDEFKEEVLKIDSDILLELSSSCANCDVDGTDGKKLLLCGGCKLTFYCSKACQTSHWKSGHKTECKALFQRAAAAAAKRASQNPPPPAQPSTSSKLNYLGFDI